MGANTLLQPHESISELSANRPLRVFVVDDEPQIRDVCRLNLESAGHTVVEARDGLVALKMARAEQLDVIVLDLMLPMMDGWQLAERLLAGTATSSIPLVFLSGQSDGTTRARALTIGAAAYVTKPFDPEQLVTVVERVGAGSTAAGEAQKRSTRDLARP